MRRWIFPAICDRPVAGGTGCCRPRRQSEPPVDRDNLKSMPVNPEYSEDGIDVSLIRWTLSLTPLARLEFLEERINEIQYLRELNATD